MTKREALFLVEGMSIGSGSPSRESVEQFILWLASRFDIIADEMNEINHEVDTYLDEATDGDHQQ